MPNYGSNSLATLLRDNQQKFFWNAEAVAAGTQSIAFQLERVNRTFYPWGLSFEVVFAADPGVFEIDIMGANNDLRANYISLGSIAVVNSTFVGRYDMASNLWPKYIAGYVKTLTNAVNLTLQVTK